MSKEMNIEEAIEKLTDETNCLGLFFKCSRNGNL